MRIKRKSVCQIIFFLLVFILVVKSIDIYSGLSWQIKLGGRVASKYAKVILEYECIICLLLWILTFLKARIRTNCTSLFSVILILSGLMWSFVGIHHGLLLFVKNGTPLMLVNIGCLLLLGQEEDIFLLVKKTCGYLAVGYTLLCFVKAIMFVAQYTNVRMESGDVMYYYATALFLTAIWNCFRENSFHKTILFYVCCIMLVITSIITTSRGWMIQSVILTTFSFVTNSDKRAKTLGLNIFLILVVCTVGGYIIINYMREALSFIIDRFSQDTRSGQLQQFFEQVSLYKLIIGQGIDAQYVLDNQLYSYIDNQYLFISFRYGIYSIVAYMFPFLVGLVKNIKLQKIQNFSINIKNYKCLIVMWLLALGGLSIYYGISCDIMQVYLIIMVSFLARRR